MLDGVANMHLFVSEDSHGGTNTSIFLHTFGIGEAG